MFRDKGWTDGNVLGEDEIPADPSLPQIATMLDGRAMGRILQDELPGGFAEGRLRIERCRVVYVCYRPTRNCLVSYSLDIRDTATGRCGTQLMCGKIFAEARSKRYLATRAKRMSAVPDYDLSFAYLVDHQMIVTAFPNDLMVRGLHQIVYRDELEPVVRGTLGLRVGQAEGVEDGSSPVGIISYKPERSCLVRCAVRCSESASQRDQGKVVFARIYHNDRGDEIYRAMKALWNGEARRSGLLAVAEPLGYDPTARILFQGSVGGTILAALAGCEEFLDYVGVAARSLAAIHQSPVRLERARTTEGELEVLELLAQGLIQVRPMTGEKLNRILGRLRRAMPGPPGQGWGLIHGDFSHNQILVKAGHVSVIDFDGVGMGDPCTDIGSFLARLERPAVEGGLEGSLRHWAAEEFCRQYEAAQRGVLARDRLIWHQAMGLVRLAVNSLKHLKSAWPRRVDNYLSRAETLLSEQKRMNHRSASTPHVLTRWTKKGGLPCASAFTAHKPRISSPESLD